MEEKDVIVNEMIRDTEELKETTKVQEQRLSFLEENVKEVFQKAEEHHATLVSRLDALVASQKPVDLSILTTAQKQGLEEIKAEIKKQQFQIYETKHYSVFGDHRFSADRFKVVLDTIMKWVIALILTLSLISIVKFWIHYQ